MLDKIALFLKKQSIILSRNTRDGRLNSAFNEDEILGILESKFNINRPKMRDWVDFSFEYNDIFYPVNIKISTTKTNDNLNCKLGIYYALTGKFPHFDNEISWDCYFKNLSQNITQNDADYYFLIINKNDSSDIFHTSLKALNKLTPNGNNLPFQAKWGENRTIIERDFSEARDFILGAMAKSFYLRAKIYDEFLTYFPHFRES